MTAWYDSRFTGLFSTSSAVPRRPHDPDVAVWSGTVPPWGPRSEALAAGGAGWDAADALAACVGEAVERWQPYPLPQDRAVEASFNRWPLDEPAVEPGRWVLFHAEQYAQADFPFAPFTAATVCRWVCFRLAVSGEPCWVPEELAYLFQRQGMRHRIAPAVSTGLSAGRVGQPVLLRGLQEVIERDAVVGAWWGSYPLEVWDAGAVFGLLGEARLLVRPNLRYRFYRVGTPYSDHVVIVTVEGEDHEGFCFSAGSACRETRAAAWLKGTLEAVHGRHYVRYLRGRMGPDAATPLTPASFEDHAVFYSYRLDALRRTPLHQAVPSPAEHTGSHEDLPRLVERLGPDRPVLFRLMTPPGLAAEVGEPYVLKVVVPGLQPLHGNHQLPHLGGPVWAPRGLREWATMPPHPFP